ncbi:MULTISPECIES: phosphoribosylglycinamide formyltransferase [unclassified Agreia]|uniref:phosphoribosylglycinamide formyltransferase n=1 Tax=unclassified Agreia TaxID=2641148 RepID=UPI0006F9531E|nr:MULTISPECIES: phosphoribosylglycinamide formyltransferase [Microbacteriaceae]KQM59727.1 phosphoribosylglycinamide formyltransferase [Agreia sp. Leaf210]KQR20782.1 phosphoribosylglycinamide formyltransferase [Agreia sp. Leaf335]PPF61760.1 phosphoribosylglycinamide formyltransferase [Clavibacter michiganensis]
MLSLVVLISGGGSNLRALLDAQSDAEFPARIVAVGADNDAAGLAHAEEFGVPTFTVPPTSFESRAAWGDELLEQIRVWNPDLVVCAGFMRILPPRVVSALSPFLINTHPALLPAFPGAHAVRDALAAGAAQTGVTVHIVDEGVDTGPVIVQEVVAIEADDTEPELHERIKTVERRLLTQAVLDIANSRVNLRELATA